MDPRRLGENEDPHHSRLIAACATPPCRNPSSRRVPPPNGSDPARAEVTGDRWEMDGDGDRSTNEGTKGSDAVGGIRGFESDGQ